MNTGLSHYCAQLRDTLRQDQISLAEINNLETDMPCPGAAELRAVLSEAVMEAEYSILSLKIEQEHIQLRDKLEARMQGSFDPELSLMLDVITVLQEA